MKPEFMRLRRALAGTVAALLLAVGIVALSPTLSASAHVPSITASCTGGLTVDLKSYPEGTNINVTVNGAVLHDVTLGSGWSNWYKNIAWDKNTDNSYSVVVKSPDDPGNTKGWSVTKSGTVEGCPPLDKPGLSVDAQSCTNPSTQGGTVSFTLQGVAKQYTVTLNGTTKTVASSGGAGSFPNVPAGTYTVTATTSSGESATSPSVTLTGCSPAKPVLALTVAPCVSGGSLGAVTASLSSLALGSSYQIRLLSAAGNVLDTLSLTATTATATLAFPGHGPGTYYATVTGPGDALLATSSTATITECATDLAVTVELEPCDVFQLAPADEISVTVDGMSASTVYTVRLVTADAAANEISSTTTPGGTATTFSHTFTGAVAPGDYRVTVTGGTHTVESDTVSLAKCGLDTLAPPSIELLADRCDASGSGIEGLTARLIDLDATKTYYVRIVDAAGVTAPGGEDRSVTGSTTATVKFPGVTTAGTYTAELLIDPGKQLAATSPAAVGFSVCLPTLAMTGPGVLLPLGSVAALLLTLGGALVTGRLRRRMAL